MAFIVVLTPFVVFGVVQTQCSYTTQSECAIGTYMLQQSGYMLSNENRCVASETGNESYCFSIDTAANDIEEYEDVVMEMTVTDRINSDPANDTIYDNSICFSGGEENSYRQNVCEEQLGYAIANGVSLSLDNPSSGCYQRNGGVGANTDYCYNIEPVDLSTEDVSSLVEQVTGSINGVVTSCVVASDLSSAANTYNRCCSTGSDSEEAADRCSIEKGEIDLVYTNTPDRVGQCSSPTADADENFSSCFVYEVSNGQQYGEGEVCGPGYAADANGSPVGGESSSNYANSLSSCSNQKNEYENSNTRNCIGRPIPNLDGTSSVSSVYRMCADIDGLLRKSDQEIADQAQVLEDARNLAIAQARAAALAAQQAAYDATRFGGAAGGLVPECGDDGTGSICGWLDLIQLINNIINFIIWAAAIIMVLVLLIAGFKLVTSQGKPEALADAKEAMGRAILGFCVVLFAWLLVNAVMTSLLRSDFLTDNVSNLLER